MFNSSVFKPFAQLSGRTRVMVIAAEAAIFLVLWVLAPFALLPTPLEVLRQLGYQVSQNGLLYNLGVSMFLNLEAIGIATVIAFLLAYSYVLPFMRPIAIAIAYLRYFGILGISFFFIVFIRDSHWVKVAILVFGLLPYFTAPLIDGVSSVESSRLNHARTLKLGDWGTTFQVIIRGRLFQMIEVIRQNASIAWMMVATVEGLIRSEGGIGVLLVEQSKYLHMADLFAILALIFVVGALQDFLIKLFRNVLCPYETLNTRSM